MVKIISPAQLLRQLQTPLYRNAYALILSDFVASGLGLLYWALAARLYTPEQVGHNAAAISTMMLLAGLAFVPVRGALLRFLPQAGAQAGRLIGYAYLASVVLALVVSTLFLLGYQAWAPPQDLLARGGAVAPWLPGVVVVWSLFVLQDQVLTGLRQAVWVPVENIGFGLAKIGLLLLLTNWWPHQGIFMAWTLPVPLLVLSPLLGGKGNR